MSNNPMSGDPVNYYVTGQQEGTGQNENGQFVRGVTVTYRWGGNNVGQVFVPLAHWKPDVVQAAIVERIRTARAIGGLTGTV